MIDYIINITNQRKIYYIGFSQGATALYVTLSVRPEYNSKLRLATLLAPVAFMGRVPDLRYRILSTFLEPMQVIYFFLNYYIL